MEKRLVFFKGLHCDYENSTAFAIVPFSTNLEESFKQHKQAIGNKETYADYFIAWLIAKGLAESVEVEEFVFEA